MQRGIVNFFNRLIRPKTSIPVEGVPQTNKPEPGKVPVGTEEEKQKLEKRVFDEVDLKFGHLRER